MSKIMSFLVTKRTGHSPPKNGLMGGKVFALVVSGERYDYESSWFSRPMFLVNVRFCEHSEDSCERSVPDADPNVTKVLNGHFVVSFREG